MVLVLVQMLLLLVVMVLAVTATRAPMHVRMCVLRSCHAVATTSSAASAITSLGQLLMQLCCQLINHQQLLHKP
jgi:hypothetical protein